MSVLFFFGYDYCFFSLGILQISHWSLFGYIAFEVNKYYSIVYLCYPQDHLIIWYETIPSIDCVCHLRACHPNLHFYISIIFLDMGLDNFGTKILRRLHPTIQFRLTILLDIKNDYYHSAYRWIWVSCAPISCY
jgi:hypothetical protein